MSGKKENLPNPVYVLRLLGLVLWLVFLLLPENRISPATTQNPHVATAKKGFVDFLPSFSKLFSFLQTSSQTPHANTSGRVNTTGENKERKEQSSLGNTPQQTLQAPTSPLPENVLKDLFVEQANQQNTLLQDIRTMITRRQTNAYNNSSVLQEIYEKTKDKKILAGLIHAYQAEFSYKEAYNALLLFDERERTKYLDGQTIVNILLNAPVIKHHDQETIGKVEKYIVNLHHNGFITADDKAWYLSLLALLKRDLMKAQSYRVQIKTKYKDILHLFATEIQAQASVQDMPAYYLDAKIAMHLVRYGYFRIAQQIALQIIPQNPKYILPFQILAFSHFVMQDWEIASDYLENLLEIDSNPTNYVRYNFLLGIALFWQKKYSKAIIAFTQSTIPEFQGDITRYLLMSYEKIGDTHNMVKTYQRLLGQPDIDEFDFFLYFEQAFYKPFATRSPYTLYEQNKILGGQYVFRCTHVLPKSKQNICEYGKAGLALVEGRHDEAAKILVKLTRTFPTSYIWQALGDYYLAKNDTKNARIAYIKALSLAADMQAKLYAREKLLYVMGVRQ